jgi:hypothetical protein
LVLHPCLCRSSGRGDGLHPQRGNVALGRRRQELLLHSRPTW